MALPWRAAAVWCHDSSCVVRDNLFEEPLRPGPLAKSTRRHCLYNLAKKCSNGRPRKATRQHQVHELHRVSASMSNGGAGAGPARKDFTAVMVVPTGVGASIGGYAGDALPTARTLASVVDCLITHPNVLNGAMLYWPIPNALYVEGHGLDQFAAGKWGLQPVHQNRIGLVLDAGMEDDLRLRHLQVADAARATLGLPVFEYTVTDEPLQVDKWIDGQTGASTGKLGRPDALLRAVDRLLGGRQVDAVAVIGRFPDDSLDAIEDYRHGQGVDALAGVEAVISRMVVEAFRVPCAHAPALQPIPLDPSISPRSAAEELGHTFLPCVLAGLSRAPRFVSESEGLHGRGVLSADDVDAVIIPVDVCGGAAVRSFAARAHGRRPLLIAVEENETVMNDTPESLGFDAVRVANYWEAVGVVAAYKAGVDPVTLRRDSLSLVQRV